MKRKAHAEWKGGLKDGKGSINTDSGALTGSYSFPTRFENADGTNPEELLGAAEAACFSMALAHKLEKNGSKPQSINTTAVVSLDKEGEGFAITDIQIETTCDVPGLEQEQFQKIAEQAKDNCPVSKALSGVKKTLKAELVASSAK